MAASTINRIEMRSFSLSFSIPRARNSMSPTKNQHLHISFPLSQTRVLQESSKSRQLDYRIRSQCAKWGPGLVPMAEIEDEMNSEEEEDYWLGNWKEKCRERDGVAELLECLENEAITGEDEGKDPTDYNRRARIFDKSSRLFQALKERETACQEETAF